MKSILFFNKISFFLSSFIPLFLFALPSLDKIVDGSVSIEKNQNKIEITQNSTKAIIDWTNFSLNENEKAKFIQESNFSVLNRVVSDEISKIYGSIEANGKFYLVNQNGIIIGPKGIINANEVILSTLEICNDDYLNRNWHFKGESNSKIQNFGSITAINSDVFIISKNIENYKEITAKKGKVNLIASSEVLIVDNKNDIIIKPDIDSSITNEGNIRAIEAFLKSSNNNLDSLAINQKGLVEAKGFYKKDGKVILCAEKGALSNEGKIIAKNEDESSGKIHIFANEINLKKDSLIDVSSKFGNGEILIGGDFQGKNPNIQNAKKVFVEEGSNILADAKDIGNGGKIILWSDEKTSFFGNISAKGGKISGDGGFCEISSAKKIKIPGSVDLRAFNGKTGTVLFDPYDLTISTSATYPDRWTNTDPNRYDAEENTDNIQASDISTKLSTANVIITTGSGGSDDYGFVTIETGSNINWSTSSDLTIEASNGIVVQTGASIDNTAGSGDITLKNYATNNTVDYHGVTIQGSISSGSGKIIIEGKGSQRLDGPSIPNYGLHLDGGTLSSGSNNIEITAIQGLKDSKSILHNGIFSSTSGDIYFITDGHIQFNNSLSSVGNLIFKPITLSTNVNVANLSSGLSIDSLSLDQITKGFNSITFGDVINTNCVNLYSYTFQDPVDFIGDSININGALNVGANDLILDTNSIDLSYTITGTGNFSIYPKTASKSIGIGAGSTGDLILDAGDLNNIVDGFSTVTIGNSTVSAVDIQASNFNDNLIVVGDRIDVNGSINNAGNSITLKVGQGSNPGILNLKSSLTASSLDIEGGSNNDSFAFNIASGTTTSLDGSGGTNSIELAVGNNTWTIDGSGSSLYSGTISGDIPLSYDKIHNLKSSTGTNTFNINTGGMAYSIDGSNNGDNTYNINGGDITSSITTGTGDAIFVFADGKGLSVSNGVTINPYAKNKLHKIDYSAYTTPVLINMSNEEIYCSFNDATFPPCSTTGFKNREENGMINTTNLNNILTNISIPTLENCLVGPGSVWEIFGIFSGTVNGIPYASQNIIGTNNDDTFNFSSIGTQRNVLGIGGNDIFNFGYDGTIPGPVNWTGDVLQNLIGAIGGDIFIFWGNYQISATINGTGGNDEIRGPSIIGANTTTSWIINDYNGEGSIQPQGAPGPTNFLNIEHLTGSNRDDTFTFTGPYDMPLIDGGGGTNTLNMSTGVDNTWNITDNNAGNVLPAGANTTNFINIQNLIGNIGTKDTFILADNKGLSGFIDGGACGEGNLLNYSAYTTSFVVSPDCTGGSGTATNILGGIIHIDDFFPKEEEITKIKTCLCDLFVTYDLKRFVEFNTFLQRCWLIYIETLRKDNIIKLIPRFEDFVFRDLKKLEINFFENQFHE